MLLGAAAFFTWARLRPGVVPEAGDEGAGSGRPEH